MEDLRGQHVLVTGATGTLGAAVATTLLVSGATVTAAARRRTALDALRAEHPRSDRFHTAEADVTRGDHVESLFDALERGTGPLHAVVHCVGAYAHGPLGEVTEGTLELLDVALFRSAVLVTRAAVRRMVPRRTGRIVLVGALAAAAPTPGMAVYGALKAAVGHFVQSVAAETHGDGLTVNAVLPGELVSSAGRAAGEPERDQRGISPSAVAKAIAVLLGDGGRGITGSLLAMPSSV